LLLQKNKAAELSEIAEIAELASKIQETKQFWMFIAVGDDVTCDACNRFDMSLMTRKEIQKTFPYLINYSDGLWFPMVHPNCRCMLILWEIEMLYWTEKRFKEFIQECLMKKDSFHATTVEMLCPAE